MNGRKCLFEMIKSGCDTLQIPKSKDRKGQSFKKKQRTCEKFAFSGRWQRIFSAVSAAILSRQNDHQVARRKVTLQLFRHSRKVVLIRKRPRTRNDKDGQMAFARLYG